MSPKLCAPICDCAPWGKSSVAWATLPRHFEPFEFACRCGCGAQSVSAALVLRLDAVREILGRRVFVTSGRRCAKHNASPAVGGSEQSRHLIGCAADVRPDYDAPLSDLAALLALFFSTPGDEFIVYKDRGFVHVAVSRALVRPLWNGGKIEYI